jgi:hypothetical protein
VELERYPYVNVPAIPMASKRPATRKKMPATSKKMCVITAKTSVTVPRTSKCARKRKRREDENGRGQKTAKQKN